MSFLSKLGFKAAKTANDFETRIVEVETALTTARNKVADLEAKREHAIFDGVGDPDKITAELTAARADIETLTIALAGAQKRKAEAAERERNAGVERHMAEAKPIEAEERELLVAYHKQTSALADTLGRLGDTRKRREQANQFAVSNGRPDLQLDDVYAKLTEANWSAFQEHYARVGTMPVNTPAHITPPMVEGQVIISGLWPRKHTMKHLDGRQVWELLG